MTTSGSGDRQNRWQTSKKNNDMESNHKSSVTGQLRASKHCSEGYAGVQRGIVYRHDPRHVDVLVKDLGLEEGNYVQTPATHDVTEEEPDPLDQVQHSKCESQVARCSFLSQDRTDITFIVTEL